MNFTHGLIIMLLAISAAAAEIFLSFIFALSLIGAKNIPPETSRLLASFFAWCMFVTLGGGLCAPIAGAVEQLTGRKNIGLVIMVCALVVIGLLAFMLAWLGYTSVQTPTYPYRP